MKHVSSIVSDLNRNMILNLTCWQNKNGISLTFYLEMLGIRKAYVPW